MWKLLLLVKKAYNFLSTIYRHVSYVLFFMMRFTIVYFSNLYCSVYLIYSVYEKNFLSISDFLNIMDALIEVHLALFQCFELRRCIGYASPLLKFDGS